MTEIRALNEAGIEQFREFLVNLKAEPAFWPPPEILADLRYSEPVAGDVAVESRLFKSKLDFGRYIDNAVRDRIPDRVLRTSVGLWAWLTLLYIEQVCPADGNGKRKVLSMEKYIASAGHIATGLDKHLLFFPWKMVSLHGDDAAWLLGGELREDTKVVRELANSYRRNVSPPYMRLAKALYFDEGRGRVRTGATTNKPGSLRRLDRIVNQLDLTYDVFGIESDELAQLLPRPEFSRWLSRAASSS